MAHIQKLKRAHTYSYRAIIKRKGIKTITKVFSSKKLAVEFAKRVEGNREAIVAYGNSQQLGLTLSQLTENYLSNEYCGSDQKGQRHKLDFWIDAIGDKPVFHISKSDISSALSKLPSHLKNATINRYKAALSVVFSYACRYFDLPENPVRLIPSKPENNQRTRYLSSSERARLFDACKASHWGKLYLIALMAITTGARKGELLNLTWQDIDFERQTAFVKVTKNGQPKMLPLTVEVIAELVKFKQDGGLIFGSTIKEGVPYCFTKRWQAALKSADIKDFRFHDLRHTTASYLAQNGASLLEIADVLGHKQIQMTKRYSHLCIDHKSKLINRVMSDIA